jgi:hypothetical protein
LSTFRNCVHMTYGNEKWEGWHPRRVWEENTKRASGGCEPVFSFLFINYQVFLLGTRWVTDRHAHQNKHIPPKGVATRSACVTQTLKHFPISIETLSPTRANHPHSPFSQLFLLRCSTLKVSLSLSLSEIQTFISCYCKFVEFWWLLLFILICLIWYAIVICEPDGREVKPLGSYWAELGPWPISACWLIWRLCVSQIW